MEKNKTIIIIPAYNEEENIGRTIRIIKENTKNIEIDNIKVDSEIIVVNDGSTDKTAEIARNKGCEVINLPRNLGKANAFFAGIKAAIRKDADVVITMDADMLEIRKKDLLEIIKFAQRATKTKKIEMYVGNVYEKGKSGPISITSGIRAFSKPACYAILASEVKGKVRGYGLEVFLNNLFRKRTKFLETGFKAMPAFRNEMERAARQKKEVDLTKKRIQKMKRCF